MSYVKEIISDFEGKIERREVLTPSYLSIRSLIDHIKAVEEERDEQQDIVARIWKLFGCPGYEQLAGRDIYDLVQAGIDAERQRDEQSSRIADLERQLAEARAKLFPYADATEISGISFDGKYLIGDKKSIAYFREMMNRGQQIDVYKRAYDERISAAERQLAEATAENDKLMTAFDTLNKNVNYELSWGEVDGWPDDCRWRVHRRSGGRSDTEWKLIATGDTAQEAMFRAAAIRAMKQEAGE